MPAKGKQTTLKKEKAVKKESPAPPGKIIQRDDGGLAAHIARLARDVETIKLEVSRRPAMGAAGGSEGGSRRDHEKVIADRLARLDEKVDSVWNRLADLEERLEGEGGRHKHDADELDEPHEKDYYER